MDSRAVASVAKTYGTPVYLTDVSVLREAAATFEQAFGAGWVRQYSLKANHLPALTALLSARGWGANVVSLGEWALARAAGVPADRISLEGIGKTDATLRAVVDSAVRGEPIAWLAIESKDEAVALQDYARRADLGSPLDVLVRLNPGVQPDTLAELAVGDASSKFGLAAGELCELAAFLDPGLLRLRGVHVHVGSQLRSTVAWVDGVRAALRALDHVGGDTLDVGGGFPVFPDGTGPTPADFAADLQHMLELEGRQLPRRPVVEPGRALVAEAGSIIASVLHVRHRGEHQQVILDAGMSELLRPALYGARHPITVVSGGGGEPVRTAVEGPVCESADTFGTYRLPALRRGDLVAIGHTGAYGSVFASGYNGRPVAPEVFLAADGTAELVREAVAPSGPEVDRTSSENGDAQFGGRMSASTSTAPPAASKSWATAARSAGSVR